MSSYVSYAIPVLITSLLIFDVVCQNRQNVNVNNNWIRSQNQNASSFALWNTTPWPALGPRRNSAAIPINPTWVRPTQRTNSNFNTGYNPGPSQNNRQTNIQNPATVQDDELRELSESLLKKDVNNAAKYVTINLQKKTTSRSQRDEAPLPLLSVNDQVFSISSIEKMLQLHDNYVVESHVLEDYTAQERNEENHFLDTIINTAVMQHLRDFLVEKGKIGSSASDFKNILNEIWFNMYARGGRKVGSSGFEHVFLAEIKNNQISGLHNWLYFNEEEKHSRANYLGYMKKLDLGDKGAILKYHFVLRGIDKPVGSMFIGTSPELEMALYTTCFLLRADGVCPMKLNGHTFVIRTFTYRYKGKKMIGSAFPEI